MRLFLFILLFPLWIFGQNNSVGGGDPFRPYRTECTDCSNCGVQIPAGYVGYDFDIPNDYAPATSALNLYLHLFYLNTTAYYYPPATSSPTTPIVLAGNQSTIQTFINSCLVAEGFNANDIILIVNSDNTVTVWHSPSYTPNGNEFWMGTIVPDGYTNKYYPSIPTTHPTNGNTRAILVKECKTQSDIAVPNCNGTNAIQSVDQVTGTYLLNQNDKQIVRMYDNVTASLGGTIQANVAGATVSFNLTGITATNWPSVTYLIDFGTGFTDYGIGPSFDYVNERDGSYEIKVFRAFFYNEGIRFHLVQQFELTKTGASVAITSANPATVSRSITYTDKEVNQLYCNGLKVGNPTLADGTTATISGTLSLTKKDAVNEWTGFSNAYDPSSSTSSITAITPVYSAARNTFTINTIPAAYTVATITNSREITIQNLTTSDLTITTSQGPQIVGRRGVITLANPNNTTTNQTVFTGNITVAFTGSVGGTYLGQNPTVIINQKAY